MGHYDDCRDAAERINDASLGKASAQRPYLDQAIAQVSTLINGTEALNGLLNDLAQRMDNHADTLFGSEPKTTSNVQQVRDNPFFLGPPPVGAGAVGALFDALERLSQVLAAADNRRMEAEDALRRLRPLA